MDSSKNITAWLTWGVRKFGVVVFLVVLCVALAMKRPEFIGMDNIKDVLVQISGIAIAAVGMTMVILTAGIDLSVGSVLALSGCAGAVAGQWAAGTGLGVPIGFLAAIAAGAACGLSNGVMVTKVPLPPFIATLGMMGVARGLAYYVADNQPVEQKIETPIKIIDKSNVAELLGK